MAKVSMEPEELKVHAEKIISLADALRKDINDIKTKQDSLAGWQSEVKNGFVVKLDESIKKMNSMIDSAESFGKLGKDAAQTVVNTEAQLQDTLNRDQSIA